MPGAIELKKGVENLRNASPGTVMFGADSNGQPVIVDEDGNVVPSATLNGGPILFDEQAGDPNTGAGQIAVYHKTGEGLVQRAPSNGAVSTLGGGGGGFSNINWKFGTPGNPYVDTDVVSNVVPGDVVMCQITDPETLEVVFPQATPETAGQQIMIVNMIDKLSATAGIPTFTPFAGDSIGAGSADQTVSPVDVELFGTVTFISDGNGTWHGAAVGGTYLGAVPLP